MDRQEIQAALGPPVQHSLALLALLSLAPPDRQEADRLVLVDQLAQRVLVACLARRALPGLVPLVLQEVWDRLDRPGQVALAQLETAAGKELWGLQEQADPKVSQELPAIPALLASLARPGPPVSQALKVRQVLQAARGRPETQGQREAQVASELLDQLAHREQRARQAHPARVALMAPTAAMALTALCRDHKDR